MLVLGIESTCDETACAIVEDGKKILSNLVASQAAMHEVYGGVVPELSCRSHVEDLVPLIDQALIQAGVSINDLGLIAVAHAPGLVGALLIGLNGAKALSLALGIPFVGINHVEAHLYAAIMSNDHSPSYPCIGVVVSGGHTALWLMKSLGDYELIGQTVDDAAGEAFDKTAKMLGLPYPGGPQIEKLAQNGDCKAFAFKSGVIKGKPLDFSFSGLKTAVLYSIKPQDKAEIELTEQKKADIAASFQEAALRDVVDKTLLAAEKYGIKDIVLGGGVTNNKRLRALFQERGRNLNCFWPSRELSLDNAAMIAGLGYHVYERKGQRGDNYTLPCETRLPL